MQRFEALIAEIDILLAYVTRTDLLDRFAIDCAFGALARLVENDRLQGIRTRFGLSHAELPLGVISGC
jgi:hypothetical protein